MIATAIQIQEATGEAVTDFSTMIKARDIYTNRETMTSDEFTQAMWDYSAHLASLTATLVTNVCLTNEQMNEMISVIKEFDELGKGAL